jgi:hypothetical protein
VVRKIRCSARTVLVLVHIGTKYFTAQHIRSSQYVDRGIGIWTAHLIASF